MRGCCHRTEKCEILFAPLLLLIERHLLCDEYVSTHEPNLNYYAYEQNPPNIYKHKIEPRHIKFHDIQLPYFVKENEEAKD